MESRLLLTTLVRFLDSKSFPKTCQFFSDHYWKFLKSTIQKVNTIWKGLYCGNCVGQNQLNKKWTKSKYEVPLDLEFIDVTKYIYRKKLDIYIELWMFLKENTLSISLSYIRLKLWFSKALYIFINYLKCFVGKCNKS